MSELLKSYIRIFEFASRVKNKKRREQILKEMSKDDKCFKVLKEIIENTIRKNIPLKPSQKKSLKKYKRILLQFVKPKISKKNRKQLVIQSGGFLPYLVPILTSFLASTFLK